MKQGIEWWVPQGLQLPSCIRKQVIATSGLASLGAPLL